MSYTIATVPVGAYIAYLKYADGRVKPLKAFSSEEDALKYAESNNTFYLGKLVTHVCKLSSRLEGKYFKVTFDTGAIDIIKGRAEAEAYAKKVVFFDRILNHCPSANITLK